MDFKYENAELEAALARATNVDELEQALQQISRLVPTFVSPEVRGWKTFAPGLDNQVADLARRLKLPDPPPLEKGNENVCVLATRFYATGGHSKVGADICRLVGAERTTILFTDLYRQLKHNMLLSGLPASHPSRSLCILAAPTMVEKIIELYMLLAAIRPSRIILIQNHMDPVAVAAAWPFRDVVDFIHHADHQPTLGATLRFSAHVDLTYAAHRACQHAGLDPIWAGMMVPSAATPPPRDHTPGKPLRIATCAAKHKYLLPAAHRWSDFAAAALTAAPQSQIVHIGAIDEQLVQSIHGPLAAGGIDPARYRFAGAVDDLREALVREEVDVYLGSYPDSGGRATLEALAAGLAPVVPVPAEAGPLLQFDLALPYWVRIAAPEQVEEAIARSLVLSDALRAPDGQAALHTEFLRFETYVRDVPATVMSPTPDAG